MMTQENSLQLLHSGLKRVQERGAHYQVADELRISAPPLGACWAFPRRRLTAAPAFIDACKKCQENCYAIDWDV